MNYRALEHEGIRYNFPLSVSNTHNINTIIILFLLRHYLSVAHFILPEISKYFAMKKREKRVHFANFCIAGFSYYDGALVFDRLKIGQKLKLVPEPTNPVDKNAITIYLKDYKLGYVPKAGNREMSKVLYAGHNIFSAYVQMVNKQNHPEEQVRVVVFVEKNRKK